MYGGELREYLIKRCVLLIPTFIGIALVVYAVLPLLLGDPSTCCSARSTIRSGATSGRRPTN